MAETMLERLTSRPVLFSLSKIGPAQFLKITLSTFLSDTESPEEVIRQIDEDLFKGEIKEALLKRE